MAYLCGFRFAKVGHSSLVSGAIPAVLLLAPARFDGLNGPHFQRNFVGDSIPRQPLSGQKRLRIFLCDDQEFQRRLLRFPRALFPASDGIGAHIEVLREHRLAGIELPANPPDFPRS